MWRLTGELDEGFEDAGAAHRVEDQKTISPVALGGEAREAVAFCRIQDRRYSFDPSDTKSHTGLIYEPLFYIRKYSAIKNVSFSSREFDTSFIGTFRADRYESIRSIIKTFIRQDCFYT